MSIKKSLLVVTVLLPVIFLSSCLQACEMYHRVSAVDANTWVIGTKTESFTIQYDTPVDFSPSSTQKMSIGSALYNWNPVSPEQVADNKAFMDSIPAESDGGVCPDIVCPTCAACPPIPEPTICPDVTTCPDTSPQLEGEWRVYSKRGYPDIPVYAINPDGTKGIQLKHGTGGLMRVKVGVVCGDKVIKESTLNFEYRNVPLGVNREGAAYCKRF